MGIILQPFNHSFIMSSDPNSISSMLPSDQTVIQGDDVTFYCILNSKSPSSITWLKNGQQFDYERMQLDSFGPIDEVLLLRNVSVGDTGNYSCSVGEDGVKYNATLYVIGKEREGS